MNLQLQIALFAIGVIVIAVIYFISKWSDKASQSSSKSFDDFQLKDSDSSCFSDLDSQLEDDVPVLDMQMVDADATVDNSAGDNNRGESNVDSVDWHQNEDGSEDDHWDNRGNNDREQDNNIQYAQQNNVARYPEQSIEESTDPQVPELSDQVDLIAGREIDVDNFQSNETIDDAFINDNIVIDEQFEASGEKQAFENNQMQEEVVTQSQAILTDYLDEEESSPIQKDKELDSEIITTKTILSAQIESDEEGVEPGIEPSRSETLIDSELSNIDPPALSNKGPIETIGETTENISVPAMQSSSAYHYPDIEGFEKISQIDYWVKIHGERDIGRETVLAQYREAQSSLTKTNSLYGLKVPEKTWCDLEYESEETRFADIVMTVQLADSSGAISETELSCFSQLVARISEGTARGFNFMASIENAQAQAEAISDFVRYYDSVYVVNIKPEHEDWFDGAAIHRFASQLGLDPGENNFYARNKLIGKRKVCLYSVANMSETGEFDFDNMKDMKTRGVTFFTKPAINRSPGAAFAEMVDTAKAFASRIKGQVIAPNLEDLSQDDVEQIRASIEQVAQDMEDSGMPPGSDEAIRIFK